MSKDPEFTAQVGRALDKAGIKYLKDITLTTGEKIMAKKPRERTIREIDGDDATLEEIQSAGLELRDALEAEENAKLVLKAARESVAAKRDRLYLLTGTKKENRPLLGDDIAGDDEGEA